MTEEVSPEAGGDAAGSASLDGLDMSRLAEELVESARGHGVQLTGSEGLLTALTQKVLQSALEAGMANHLGRDRYERAGDPAGQSGPDMDHSTFSSSQIWASMEKT